MTSENYEKLAAAIIGQALKDYRKGLRKMNNAKTPKGKEEGGNLRDNAKAFLLSEWFMMLSDMDGEALIKAIDDMEKK